MRARQTRSRSSSPWRWSKLALTPPGTPTPVVQLQETRQALVDVFLRIRPQNPREQGEPPGIRLSGSSICVDDAQSARRQWFDFEGVIDSRTAGGCDQEKVFEAVGEQTVRSCVDGFDTCVFSLGQTGTGKTYTLLGSPEDPGLLPRAISRLLPGNQRCRLSCLELHMDRVRDLLVDGALERPPPEIRCVPGRGVYVSHLMEVNTDDAEVAIKHVHAAARNRAVARTGMNATSSRGHAIFQLSLETGARLCVVDLAGRENEKTTGCSGQALAELGYINKSLFHLGNVIQALAASPSARSPRVPFRNSKLTLLLSEYLKSARTFLVATVSPAASGVEETMATLRLAQLVRQITTKSRRGSELRNSPGSPKTPQPTVASRVGTPHPDNNVELRVPPSLGAAAVLKSLESPPRPRYSTASVSTQATSLKADGTTDSDRCSEESGERKELGRSGGS